MTRKEYKAQWYQDNKERTKDKRRENVKRYYHRNKIKCQKRKKDWAIKNKEYVKKYRKQQYLTTKDFGRDWNLKKKYNISLEQYGILLKSQNYCCAICGTNQSEFSISLSVDHNHSNNKVRGLLCHKCNRGIGLFNDSPEILDKAKLYLEKFK